MSLALLTSDTTAVAVPAGWTARLADGLLRLDRAATASRPGDAATTTRTPLGVELWGNRFQAVAEAPQRGERGGGGTEHGLDGWASDPSQASAASPPGRAQRPIIVCVFPAPVAP